MAATSGRPSTAARSFTKSWLDLGSLADRLQALCQSDHFLEVPAFAASATPPRHQRREPRRVRASSPQSGHSNRSRVGPGARYSKCATAKACRESLTCTAEDGLIAHPPEASAARTKT